MPFDFACQKIFIVGKLSVALGNHVERDTREYERRRYDAKKQRKIEKNRERMERYYMDKEDINIVAAALEDKEFDLLSQHALAYHYMS